MAKILLLETATEACSVAIAIDGLAQYVVEDPAVNQHAEKLTLFIDQALREAGLTLSELDAVAVSRGPGSYTALRVGASVAKGICYALDKPLIAVDTLAALAGASLPTASAGATVPTFLMPMLDARRQEVWTAIYDTGLNALTPAQPMIIENDLFEKFMDDFFNANSRGVFILSGNGAVKVGNVPHGETTVFSPVRSCSAVFLATLAERFFLGGDFQNIAYFEPFYMKAPNITVPRAGL